MKVFASASMLIAIHAGFVSGEVPEQPRRARDPWSADPAPDPKQPYTLTFGQRITSGYVWSISRDAITLYWPERTVLRLRHDPLTGERLEMTGGVYAAIPPKKFALSKDLAEGGYGTTGGDSATYRITDVRVGDRVGIYFDRRDGVDICRAIGIGRRPNEVVHAPPGMRFTDKDEEERFYVRQQAWKDWEKHRLPFPPGYLPNCMKGGRWFYGRYPAESVEITPIVYDAPAPREVIATGGKVAP
jgi:hypothetical protein